MKEKFMYSSPFSYLYFDSINCIYAPFKQHIGNKLEILLQLVPMPRKSVVLLHLLIVHEHNPQWYLYQTAVDIIILLNTHVQTFNFMVRIILLLDLAGFVCQRKVHMYWLKSFHNGRVRNLIAPVFSHGNCMILNYYVQYINSIRYLYH